MLLFGIKHLLEFSSVFSSKSEDKVLYNYIKGEVKKLKSRCFNGRNAIRIITFILAAFAVLGGIIAMKCKEAKIYRVQIENSYQHSLDELCGSVQNINVALEKAIYASTPSQMSSISSDILKDATIAKSYLSILPSGGQTLEKINRFLTQAGDYSATLSEKLMTENAITDDERTNIINLQKTSADLTDALFSLAAQYEEGGKWAEEAAAMLNDVDFNSVFGGSVIQMEETFTSYPSLLYDGPFSDHIIKTSPALLEGANEISETEAKQVAAKFLDISADELTYDGEENGKIKGYRFAGQNLTISVSAKGGYVTYYRKYRQIGNDDITYDTAVHNAITFAERFSNKTFTESYYFTDEGLCTVNLAYTQGSTICYTDLIKVGVAMDTGEILLFESSGYIMNHTTRTIAAPKYTAEQARSVLSEKLKVLSVKDVLIPSPGTLSEYHCYEFYCTGLNDRELLIFIDADNLAERDIQIVLRTDGGTMTK